MGSAIAMHEGFDSAALRGFAKTTKDVVQSRRLLALARIYDGGRRLDGARIGRIGRIGLQIIRDWVLRFNVDGPMGLIDRKACSPPPKLNDSQRQALAAIVESGPIPAIHGVVGWRSARYRRVRIITRGMNGRLSIFKNTSPLLEFFAEK